MVIGLIPIHINLLESTFYTVKYRKYYIDLPKLFIYNATNEKGTNKNTIKIFAKNTLTLPLL